MTTSSTRPTTRETSAYVRERGMRPLIVTVVHGILELRPKGLRSVETVDLGAVYQQAVKARVLRERLEKKTLRRARR